jgi:hypothetical protein
MVPDYLPVSILNATATNAGTTMSGYVDTLGYDYVHFNILQRATVVTSPLTGLRVREDDTVPTAFTDMSAIAALTGAAATSTSAGFVLPTNNSVVDNMYHLALDLRGRKRYIGVDMVPTTSGWCSVVALLFRGEEGANAKVSVDATLTTTVGQLRLDHRA